MGSPNLLNLPSYDPNNPRLRLLADPSALQSISVDGPLAGSLRAIPQAGSSPTPPALIARPGSQLQRTPGPQLVPPPTFATPNLNPTPTAPDLPAAAAPNVALPDSAPSQRLLRDQSELTRLQQTGSGVDQIKNPWLRGFAKVGDGLLDVVAPHLAQYAPGTQLHNQYLQRQATARIGQDQGELDHAAQLQDMQAQGQQRQALAVQEQARAQALLNPKPSAGQLLYDKNGTPIGFQDGDGTYHGPQDQTLPQGVRDVLSAAQRKQPTSAFELWQQQNPKGTAEDYLQLESEGKNKPLDQQLIDAENAGDSAKAATIRHVIQETKVAPQIQIRTASERPEPSGTWTPGVGADNKPVMFNSKTGEVRPMYTSFVKNPTAGQTAKIGADEQKRADLAQNMNENIDALEDILGRRPELFGALSGRLTEARAAFGSRDPDVAKLMTIEHQLGMVAQGAHGMRSAQGVESAAGSLVNGFKNSPEATRGALESARSSVKTFLNDSQNPGRARQSSAAGGMVNVQIPGMSPGQIPQTALDQFRRDHPNAKVGQ